MLRTLKAAAKQNECIDLPITEEFERILRTVERIEANISRQIKDLVQTKAMKQMLHSPSRVSSGQPVKSIAAPATAPLT
jgi:hypothetical protein